MSQSDVVSVPVPTKHLTKVYAFLAQLDDVPAQPAFASAPGMGISKTEWSKELVRRAYDESDTPMRAVLKLLAKSAGTPVWASEVMKAAGKTTGPQLRGQMGAFHNRCHRRYGCKSAPFSRAWKDGKATYTLPSHLAEGVPA